MSTTDAIIDELKAEIAEMNFKHPFVASDEEEQEEDECKCNDPECPCTGNKY